jgi:hypothetical protein
MMTRVLPPNCSIISVETWGGHCEKMPCLQALVLTRIFSFNRAGVVGSADHQAVFAIRA